MQSNMSLAICDLLIVRDYAKYHARYTPSFSVHMVGKKLAKPAVSGLVAANVPGSEARGEASEPIGSLAEYQMFTPSFRRGRPQSREEWQTGTECPASPKKRKADSDAAIRTPDQTLVQVIEHAVAKALRGFNAPIVAGGSLEDVQSLRREMEDSISNVQVQLTQLFTQIMNNATAKMQAEADRRADAMLQKLVQMLNSTPRKDKDKAISSSRAEVPPGRAAQTSGRQGHQ